VYRFLSVPLGDTSFRGKGGKKILFSGKGKARCEKASEEKGLRL
jgi:hypothetical protein